MSRGLIFLEDRWSLYKRCGDFIGLQFNDATSGSKLCRKVGIPLEEAIRMATIYPAKAAHLDQDLGSIEVGKRACFIHFLDDLTIQQVWYDGKPCLN